MKQHLSNLRNRLTVCRRYGHLWLPVKEMPECERIYESGILSQRHYCLYCHKTIDFYEHLKITTPFLNKGG